MFYKISAINEFKCTTNVDFPLVMMLFKAEQEKDKKLEEIPGKVTNKNCIRTMMFRDILVYTIDGKIKVPPSLQCRIIGWYHINLHHPVVRRTLTGSTKSSTGEAFDHRYKLTSNNVRNACHKIVDEPNYSLLSVVPALWNKNSLRKYTSTVQDH